MAVGQSFTVEREKGLLKRIRTTPTTGYEFMADLASLTSLGKIVLNQSNHGGLADLRSGSDDRCALYAGLGHHQLGDTACHEKLGFPLLDPQTVISGD